MPRPKASEMLNQKDGVNTQNVCIFRACRGVLVSCPAFADV